MVRRLINRVFSVENSGRDTHVCMPVISVREQFSSFDRQTMERGNPNEDSDGFKPRQTMVRKFHYDDTIDFSMRIGMSRNNWRSHPGYHAAGRADSRMQHLYATCEVSDRKPKG